MGIASSQPDAVVKSVRSDMAEAFLVPESFRRNCCAGRSFFVFATDADARAFRAMEVVCKRFSIIVARLGFGLEWSRLHRANMQLPVEFGFDRIRGRNGCFACRSVTRRFRQCRGVAAIAR